MTASADTKSIAETMGGALDVLSDCRRYLTEFGSVDPSALTFRINGVLAELRRQKDEQCYLWQLATINAGRVKRGEQPLSYDAWMAGAEQ